MIPAMVVMTPKKETIPISPTYAVNPVLKKKPPACAYGIDARRKTKSSAKMSPILPRNISTLYPAKTIVMVINGIIIWNISAMKCDSQYMVLFTPETSCKCFVLFALSLTGTTANEAVKIEAPRTEKTAVNMRTRALSASSTISPSSYFSFDSNHFKVVLIFAFAFPDLCRKIAVLASFVDTPIAWKAVTSVYNVCLYTPPVTLFSAPFSST